MTDVVGLDPDRVEALARAADRASRAVEAAVGEIGAAATLAGCSTTAAGALVEVGQWLAGESSSLRWLVAEVRSWGGRVPPGADVAVWGGPHHRSFDHPGVAHATGLIAAAALTAGHRDAAADLLDAWADDPVFAATLLGEIGAAGVVGALAAADESWGAPSPHGEAHRRLARGLAAAVASASRQPGAGHSVRDLARAADRAGHPRRLLGLLFVTPASFSSTFLVDAVRHVVVPINRRVAQGDTAVSGYRVAGGRDARALVLEAVARDPVAARRALARTELELLLPAELGYMDTGDAIGAVVVAGTAPRTAAGTLVTTPLVTGQVADLGTAAANLQRIVRWVATAGVLSPGLHARLGEVARPWIGSFRSAGLDDVVTAHVSIDEGEGRAFLRRASEWAAGARQIRLAAWRWAAAEVTRLAGPAHRGAAGFDAVGSVLGIVSIAAHDAAAATARHSDARRRAIGELWDDVATGALRRVHPLLPGIGGRGVGAALDRLLPEADLELTHWREVRDETIGAEYLALDYLVVSELWRARATNHYFDGPGRRPPPSVLVGGAGQAAVRPLAGLSETATAEYLRWRSALAAERPGPMQAAGERFLAEGREI